MRFTVSGGSGKPIYGHAAEARLAAAFGSEAAVLLEALGFPRHKLEVSAICINNGENCGSH